MKKLRNGNLKMKVILLPFLWLTSMALAVLGWVAGTVESKGVVATIGNGSVSNNECVADQKLQNENANLFVGCGGFIE